MSIEKANSEDHKILTDITKRAKGYWGYSEAQILKWDKSLTVSNEYIEKYFVYKLLEQNTIIGYYSYFNTEENTIKLDSLFILPNSIGKGYGKYLMRDFFNRLKDTNTTKIILEADPNAERFYQKLGFVKIDQFESSIQDRFIPVMEMNL